MENLELENLNQEELLSIEGGNPGWFSLVVKYTEQIVELSIDIYNEIKKS